MSIVSRSNLISYRMNHKLQKSTLKKLIKAMREFRSFIFVLIICFLVFSALFILQIALTGHMDSLQPKAYTSRTLHRWLASALPFVAMEVGRDQLYQLVDASVASGPLHQEPYR